MNSELIQFPKTCSICDQYSQSFQEIVQDENCFNKEYICQDCIDLANGIDILEKQMLEDHHKTKKLYIVSGN
ncbi:TPA: hypothetical protein ACSFAL_003203 [Acinetobacter baumannii]